MTKFYPYLRILMIACFTLAIASITQAQATRTWVSGVGDDANPCSRTAPCKTFAGAISKTAEQGEIDCIDPGGFGAVTITKSITIDGGGTFGSILAAGTNGIIINDSLAASPQTRIVRIRNLSINGAGTGFDGIRFLSARAVYIENCAIFGFRGNGTNSDGVEVGLTVGTGTFTLSVKDTIIENNTGDAIRQGTTVGTLNCHYDNVVLSGSVNGLEATGGTANISRSVIFNNSSNGLTATGGAVINASQNQISANNNGTNVVAPSTIRLSDNDFARNTTGAAGGGTYLTFGNNHFAGNTSDGVALPAPTLPK